MEHNNYEDRSGSRETPRGASNSDDNNQPQYSSHWLIIRQDKTAKYVWSHFHVFLFFFLHVSERYKQTQESKQLRAQKAKQLKASAMSRSKVNDSTVSHTSIMSSSAPVSTKTARLLEMLSRKEPDFRVQTPQPRKPANTTKLAYHHVLFFIIIPVNHRKRSMPVTTLTDGKTKANLSRSKGRKPASSVLQWWQNLMKLSHFRDSGDSQRTKQKMVLV